MLRLEAVNIINTLLERKENKEVLALHGEGSYVPCQDYKNYYTPI